MNFNNSLITWLSLAAMFNSQWVDAQELNWKPTKDKAAKQEAKLKKDKHVEPAAYYSNTFNDYTTQIFDRSKVFEVMDSSFNSISLLISNFSSLSFDSSM